MEESQLSAQKHLDAEIYEIRIQGHLDKSRLELFEGMNVARETGGTTLIYGPIPDQTALHSILLRIRNLNLKLISVRQLGTVLENDVDF